MSKGVVTPDARATRAAADILQEGGSAVDAAISASVVLGVVQPHTCGLGGDVVALVDHVGAKSTSVVLGIGKSGTNASSRLLRDEGLERIPRTHAASVVIPGALDGMLRLHHEFGRSSLERVLEPAAKLAEQGFSIDDELSEEILKTPWNDDLGPPAGIDEIRPRSGRNWWKRPSLAHFLRRIAVEGRSAFYAGDVAEEIIEASDRLITETDLSEDQALLAEPIRVSGQGLTLSLPGIPTQGVLLSDVFSVMTELNGWEAGEVGEGLHLLIESYRFSVEESVSRSMSGRTVHASGSANRIRRDMAAYRVPLHGILGGTAYLTTSDDDGCLVSMSQSNYFRMGSGRVLGSVGIPLNNRGAAFSLQKNHSNELRPNSRPFHTLIPTVVHHSDGTRTAMGTRGGLLQPQILSQLLFWSIRSNEYPASQLDAPRINIRPESASSLILTEATLPDEIAENLTLRGHRVVVRGRLERSWGPAFSLSLDPAGSSVTGVDPRSDGLAWSQAAVPGRTSSREV